MVVAIKASVNTTNIAITTPSNVLLLSSLSLSSSSSSSLLGSLGGFRSIIFKFSIDWEFLR